MKAALDFLSRRARAFVTARLGSFRPGRTRVIVCAASFLASVLVIVAVANVEARAGRPGDGFEEGMVADRDVVAAYRFSYVDEEATSLRMEAQRSLVPAVFRYLPGASYDALRSWEAFSDFADGIILGGASPAQAQLLVQAEYPGIFPAAALAAYFLLPDRSDLRVYARRVLAAVQSRRVFAAYGAFLAGHNPDAVELLVITPEGLQREWVVRDGMVTTAAVAPALAAAAAELAVPPAFAALTAQMLMPFVRENAVFSPEDTGIRVAEALERVQPVVRTVEQGQPVIRQGFVVTAQDIRDLYALQAALPLHAPRGRAGQVLLLALLYGLLILLQGRLFMGRELPVKQSSLLFVLAFVYLAGAALTARLVPAAGGLPVSLFFPSALLVMVPAVFMGHLAAFMLALVFPLGAVIAGFFDVPAYFLALVSGLAAAVVFRRAEKRMDLIKAGIKIGAANCIAVIAILLMRAADFSAYPPVLFLAVLNGIVSGMLILGLLPPLEQFLNAATTFRLIELSDLNAPVLRKLFTTAPGTYSHSVMVATLAEQACQDIGANALLARVGAYYHDIGKMENPGYFVENQTDHNLHDDIAPRLSATVIRSHIKIGAEKARQLGLPDDVVDIVSEHHGNSLILWFYKKAEELESSVNPEDFTYPGNPPRSKEAAVVMLADVTEAAVRTLAKPTAVKMEKFIRRLIDDKVESGQLARSELTFRDLEIIKNAFVRVLAGYYHSRIEYPKAGGSGGGDGDEDEP